MTERLILVRHGETEWSKCGRHTGRTDLPLTPTGEEQARLVGGTLAEWDFDAVYASPLRRATDTARIAGFDPTLDDDLMEWDYGDVEGRRNDDIVAERPGWSKWHDEVPGGEQVGDVGRRVDRVLDRIEGSSGSRPGGAVLVFAHGHFLSVTIARWLGLDASEGLRFPLSTAAASVLSRKRSDRILETFNQR